jgi:hypothetical protein
MLSYVPVTLNSQIPCKIVEHFSPFHFDEFEAELVSTLTQQWPPSRPESDAKFVLLWALPSLHIL